jgi:hypothetical protein
MWISETIRFSPLQQLTNLNLIMLLIPSSLTIQVSSCKIMTNKGIAGTVTVMALSRQTFENRKEKKKISHSTCPFSFNYFLFETGPSSAI